ncbi:hypothetical protein Taro_001492 [Colocasia esculenta]|uniref:DUF3511 domain protein n=1 Tax=Colocasia esculenta TaxID=4460 RepID=A0A843TKV4_COLES|nr:hypothetical protein [Colocasia esculenta]
MGFSMEDFRSRSCGEGRTQMEVYGTRTVPASGLHDLRCYSASNASAPQVQPPKEIKFNKGKGSGYGGSSSSSSKGGWSFKDPELQRKKRVASYKVYAVEGKMKGTLRKSFKWLKDRYSQVVYGWS